MSMPRLGYLCLSENPSAEAGRALVRQFVLVREADRMGYDDIWLAEHPDDAVWPQGGVIALLGHLAAVTSKARIGALPVVPALHGTAQLAVELATLDLLAKGRLELGVASGRALAPALARLGLGPADAAARLREATDELCARLQPAAGAGAAAQVPLPQQQPVPLWVAADDPQTVRWAARHGHGLIAAATHSQQRVQRMRALYLEASGGRAPELVLARFACSADTADEALALAQPYLQGLAARAVASGWGADAALSLARDPAALCAASLVGAHDEVARRFKALAESHGATRVAIVPTSGQFDAHKHILAAFVDEVRPLLEDD